MNSISPNLNIMIKAAEKASKILIRDFGELEKLQVSSKGPSDFVTNSDKKVEKILIEELTKSRNKFSIISEEIGEVKNSDKDEPIIVVASRSHLGDKVLEFVKKYDNYEFLQMGSSIKLCLVADGTADIYPRLGPTMEWDTAAAHAVVLHAGGDVVDNENGKRLTYNKPNLLNPDFVVLANGSVLC